MLPRISNALKKFVHPITAKRAAKTVVDSPQEKDPKETFERFRPKKEKQDSPPQETAPKKGNEKTAAEPEPEPASSSDPEADAKKQKKFVSVTQAVLQIFARMRRDRELKPKSAAHTTGAYNSARKRQKKGGKAHKGSMFDEEAS